MPELKSTSIHQLYNRCVTNGYPFALYRLPKSEDIRIVVQTNSDSKTITHPGEVKTNKGFLFYPFQPSILNPIHFINADLVGDESTFEEILNHLPEGKEQSEKPNSDIPYALSQEEFEDQVARAINEIGSTPLDKIIQFRVQHETIDPDFSALEYFKALCQQYPSAFCYLLNIPGTGTWMGASPEKLLTIQNNTLETVALAATQSISGRHLAYIDWTDKEKAEQEIVASFIKHALLSGKKENLTIHGPTTVAAGKIAHICTTFRQSNFNKDNWTDLASRLHPTPAIGGLPQNLALEYIRKNEVVDRSYYAGFLGPVNIGDSIHLYVNIRCMQVLEHALALYVGCGITADSDPKNEFMESYHKSLTLLNVLQKNYDL